MNFGWIEIGLFYGVAVAFGPGLAAEGLALGPSA